MFIILVIGIFSLLIAIILYCVSVFISSKLNNRNKIEPYERGFRRVGKVQTTFSVHFFVILLIFLIFDLEIIFLLITLFVTPGIGVVLLLLIIFVVGGVYLEWLLNKLKW